MNELSELISGIKNGGKIVLEQGREYHVYEADGVPFTLSGKGEASAAAAVCLIGKKNVVIDGAGSAIKIHGNLTAFALIGCKNVQLKNVTADYVYDDEEKPVREGEKKSALAAAACVVGCNKTDLSSVRLRYFKGCGFYVEASRKVRLYKSECVVKDGASTDGSGYFRFDDCKKKVVLDECVLRGGGAPGDFVGVRGNDKCNLVVKNSYAFENAGRGVYYAAAGKAFVRENTFSKTGGAALCARDCKESGAPYVKKIVFANNVVIGCGNAYEEKYAVAYFPTDSAGCENCPSLKEGKTACAGKKTVGKLLLKENHFFNPEDEEHRIYLAGVKKAVFKNNSFDRPYKIDRANVRKLTEKDDVAAEKCQ